MCSPGCKLARKCTNRSVPRPMLCTRCAKRSRSSPSSNGSIMQTCSGLWWQQWVAWRYEKTSMPSRMQLFEGNVAFVTFCVHVLWYSSPRNIVHCSVDPQQHVVLRSTEHVLLIRMHGCRTMPHEF